jgi:hypothetical protein
VRGVAEARGVAAGEVLRGVEVGAVELAAGDPPSSSLGDPLGPKSTEGMGVVSLPSELVSATIAHTPITNKTTTIMPVSILLSIRGAMHYL